MTSNHLDDHLAKSLESIARSQGLSLTEYLATIARSEADSSATKISADQILAMIEAESGVGNPEYRGTFTRGDVYLDHD